jgi:neutral amino acid transport system permease protein
VRRAVILLTALLGSVIFALGFGSTGAWAQDEGLQGRLRYEDAPVPGVSVDVFSVAGGLIGSAVSDDDGYWMVPVPGSDTYRVVLDASTLPAGLVVTTGDPVREPFVRPGSVGNVLFPLGTSVNAPGQPAPSAPGDGPELDDEIGEELPQGRGTVGRIVSSVYSGIHFGLIIALAALGLSLIFGTMGLVNFSHGELVSFGALMALLFNVIGVFGLRLHLLVAVPVAVALGALFGYLQDRFFWGWLRRRGTGLIAMMIVSIGVALLLRNGYLYFFGGERRRYAEYSVQQPLELGPLTVPPKTLIVDGVALLVLLAVTLALVLTRLGRATRAVADNPHLAAASGINVDRIIRLVWATGAGLAALAGVLLAIHEAASFQMGFQILLLIFAAVVVGGLGTVYGAVLGALIVGIFIQVSTLHPWIPTEFKYVGALALLIVVLLIRPQGILGRRERVG